MIYKLFTISIIVTYIKLKCLEMAIIVDFTSIILISVAILISPISTTVKLIILFIVFYIYRINIKFLVFFTKMFYKRLHEFKIDDNITRSIVTKTFNECFHIKHNFDKLPNYPTILVTNYIYDRVEHLACIMIPKKIAVVMARWFVEFTRLNYIIEHVIYRENNGHSYNNVKNQIKQSFDNGLSPLAYVTRNARYKKSYVSSIRKGIFSIAKELNIPVTPIAIDYIHHNYGIIPYQTFCIKIGDTFKVTDVKMDAIRTRSFLSKSLMQFKKNKGF